jgi:3-oxoacyl-[acyl-carrier-protein] synthase III
MGARIEAVTVRRGRGGPWRPGALRLSDMAARDCLAQAKRRADELDLLINAGLYKDDNTAEPAMASIIQEDIGANPGHPPKREHHGTFSFDVMNGGCGVVSALQILDAFVGPATAQLGMVVAADADPAPHRSRGFPFPPVGGAILLAASGDDAGFAGFEVRTFAEDAELFEAVVRFDPETRRSVAEVHEHPRFAARCLERARAHALGFLDRARLRPVDVDVLVASAYPPGFAIRLARAVGIPAACVPAVAPELDHAHTAAPIAALAAARASGLLGAAHRVLFVTVGAGITVAAALYQDGRG